MIFQLIDRISRFVGFVSAGMIVLSIIITCQMIFVRYFLNKSTVWQTEAIIYLMVSATLLGLPYVQVLRGHVNVNLIPMILNPLAKKGLIIGNLTISILVLSVMSGFGYELTSLAFRKNWTSDTIWAFPLWIPYLAMPLGFGLFALQLTADLFKIILKSADKIDDTVDLT